MRRACRLAISNLVLATAGISFAFADTQLIGRPAGEFSFDGDPPMRLPTGVTVTPNGEVWVADGVNDRILRFSQAGAFIQAITHVGDAKLSRPMNVRSDAGGRLWIADTGSQRVVVLEASGDPGPVYRATTIKGRPAPDITDVLPALDGSIWLVDNENAWLTRVDIETKLENRTGGRGESLGQFQHPFMAALGAGGDIWATDVINGRVVLLDEAGQAVGSAGSYGVSPGQFYRPVGAACDGAGVVWVSDCVLGVVQAFSKQREYLGVLRDEAGRPLRFQSPMGLAFDSGGHLYVVEQTADRVRKISIESREVASADVRVSPRRVSMDNPQPRACTACHFEWMSPFDQGQGTELAQPPDNPSQHPYVSRSANCLSCHNGVVVDSRRRVWTEHGHRTGAKPPEDMHVSADLPLLDGKLICRTCHSAHTRGGSGNLMKDAVFLRVSESPLELCASCHAGYDGGVATAMHPVGPMSISTPPEFTHGEIAQSDGEVTCLVCHQAHGAGRSDLLALNIGDNGLCLSCHGRLNPELFGEEAQAAHADMPRLDADQKSIASAMSKWIGSGDRMLCMTCHMSHRANTTNYLLASDDLRESACSECHAPQRGVGGSPHDMTSADIEGGVCVQCHGAHRFSRETRPTPLDQTGMCTTCHVEGGEAESKVLGELNHADAACEACHNPHETRFGDFLAGQASALCKRCHADHAGLAGGVHDVMQNASAWSEEARETGDTCLACHRPHGDPAAGLFRVAWREGPRVLDAACLACHEEAAGDAIGNIALVHPRGGEDLPDDGSLSLYDAEDGSKRIGCKTCHDPHARHEANPSLLHVANGAEDSSLCIQCHVGSSHIETIGHSASSLRAAGFESGGCQPCHQVHAAPHKIEARLLAPKSLLENDGAAARVMSVGERLCAGCHNSKSSTPPPQLIAHPPAVMYNAASADENGYLPLFDAEGRVDQNGEITCRTCHLTHGRTTPGTSGVDVENMSPREQRARKWSLRTFGPASVCNTCHGFDALRRFLYFHQPAGRGGAPGLGS